MWVNCGYIGFYPYIAAGSLDTESNQLLVLNFSKRSKHLVPLLLFLCRHYAPVAMANITKAMSTHIVSIPPLTHPIPPPIKSACFVPLRLKK